MKGCAVLLLLVVSGTCQASCLAVFPALAKVEVISCQAIELGASPSKSNRTARIGAFPHKQGEVVRGTLLTVDVLDSQSVSLQTSVDGIQAATEVPTGVAHYVVQGEVVDVCPEIVPRQISIIVESRCCDSMPMTGNCISPFPQVEIETHPGRWHAVSISAET